MNNQQHIDLAKYQPSKAIMGLQVYPSAAPLSPLLFRSPMLMLKFGLLFLTCFLAVFFHFYFVPPTLAQGPGPLNPFNPWTSNDDDNTYSVAWGDVDGDGDLDLAAGNGGSANKIYLNQNGVLQTTASWTSNDDDDTYSVAWGDVDGDGDLDLAAGNIDNSANKVYLNQNGVLQTTASWTSDDDDSTYSVAWGDVDGDGDLDLAAGNGGLNRVYLNQNGVLQTTASWISSDSNPSTSVAWGDVDGDSDLDLAAGNGGLNRVYLNQNGVLQTTASWIPTPGDNNATRSVAWGDVDGDGDLDLAAGNGGSANKVYLNQNGVLQTTAVYTSGDSDWTTSLAWGDVDGDGDLDLAAGNIDNSANKVYLNQNGVLQTTASWISSDDDDTRSVAWGDVDGDGDLDLAAGNLGRANKVYLNQNGVLQTTASWISNDDDDTRSVAWGDVDGDGDLDLAAGNSSRANKVYLNQNGVLQTTASWISSDDDDTRNVAWGDVDGDGDLDLAAGNRGSANKVYLNQNGMLQTTASWISSDNDDTPSVAWGDVDGDSDLDLAAGNIHSANKVYLNQNGVLQTTATWTSGDSNPTISVAWGDVDGDGDLDLAAGNSVSANKVYLKQNDVLQTASNNSWTSGDNDITWSVAWGDVDGDGDLDLAAGNSGSANKVYLSGRQGVDALSNNPPSLTLTRPDATHNADFYAAQQIALGPTIPLTYTLFDSEGDPVRFIRAFYSPNGGGQWLPATLTTDSQTTTLAASLWPTGTTHTLIWQADADLIKNDNVAFRIEAYEGFSNNPGPFQRPYASAQTFSFRVQAADWFAKVISGTSPMQGAQLYQDGQLLTKANVPDLTDRAGLIKLNPPQTITEPLAALAPIHTQATIRAQHDGWAYRVYHTNLNLDPANPDDQAQNLKPNPDVVTRDKRGEQLVTIRFTDTLVLFNIVASVEWDATDAYLTMLEDAFKKASAYLYDVTDGQMAFGQVTIYDKAEHWADADFQFSAKNTVRPYAFVGGITDEDTAHSIRLGRGWDRTGSDSPWNQPDGYRTIIHEFGHYALFLYDEYIGFNFNDEGEFENEIEPACTSTLVKNPESDDATNASIMYWQYNATELADPSPSVWQGDCLKTEQHSANNGEADWETVLRKYSGPGWQLTKPSSHGPAVAVLAGPDQFPTDLLPFPQVSLPTLGEGGGAPRQLRVLDQGQPMAGALVALYTIDEEKNLIIAMDQGLTNAVGQIQLFGAKVGDTIRAATFDAALSGSAVIENSDASLDLHLGQTSQRGLALQAGPATPYLNLVPGTDGRTLTLRVVDALPGNVPLNGLIIPGEGGGNPQFTPLTYSNSNDSYNGSQLRFSNVGLGTGQVQVNGLAGGQVIALNSDYNLQALGQNNESSLYSEDGNFELHLPEGAVPADEGQFATVLPTGHVPVPLPTGKQAVGSAYEVRFSGSLTHLDKAGLVRLHYHPEVMGQFTDMGLFYWNAAQKMWEPLPEATFNEVDQAWSAPDRRLGIYALMGVIVPNEQPYQYYFPLISKP